MEFNYGTILKVITWIFKFRIQVQHSAGHTSHLLPSFPRHVTWTKLIAKPLPVKISPHRGMEDTTAGSSGDDGHHVVGTENLNPVAVRVLNEGQAAYFTCWRKTQGQKLTRIDFKTACNTLSNHRAVLNRPHWSINKDLPSFGFLTNGTPCSSNSLQAA